MIKIKGKKIEKNKEINHFLFLLLISIVGTIVLINFTLVGAAPEGPDELNVLANETKGTVGAQTINISGGRIATLNLSATVQNPRWKAFVGNVTGTFTLDDGSGSTIYDWTLSSITGRVYATRNSSTISWTIINCSNGSILNQEDLNMNHSNANDNISTTFNATNHSIVSGFGSHASFFVGAIPITANSCPTLNTYVDNSTQDSNFEEMALYDNESIVYATILEEDQSGFDENTYDFQMIVPENGLATFTGQTAYYIYVEIG